MRGCDFWDYSGELAEKLYETLFIAVIILILSLAMTVIILISTYMLLIYCALVILICVAPLVNVIALFATKILDKISG